MFSVGIEKKCWPEMVEVVVSRCSSGYFQIANFTAKQTTAPESLFLTKLQTSVTFFGVTISAFKVSSCIIGTLSKIYSGVFTGKNS